MTKVGRNDPCHCGSGKKYKKCCEEKDEKEIVDVMISERNTEESEKENKLKRPIFSDIEEEDDFFLNSAEDDYFDEDEYDDYDDDDDDDDLWQSEKPYPEISNEDQQLVDEWWEKYQNIELTSTDEIRKHIETFMNLRPDLVENLGLEHEVLFDLAGNYTKEGRLEDYVNLLLRFRTEFFSTYERSAEYYSYDIIAYLVANNKLDEVHTYFNDFIIDYKNSKDKIVDLINLFLALGKPELAHALTDKINQYFKSQGREPEMGEEEMILPWIIKTQSKYLRSEYSDKDITDFINEVTTTIPNSINPDPEFWKELFGEIFRPFEPWQENIPKKTTQIEKYFRAVGHNYMGYLHEIKGTSWESSIYFSKLIYEYLAVRINNSIGKIKSPFDFTFKTMEELLKRFSYDYFHINPVKELSMLNAIYYFASYLQHCGNIDNNKMETVQEDCTRLMNKIYSEYSKEYPEALCFEKFPVWG